MKYRPTADPSLLGQETSPPGGRGECMIAAASSVAIVVE
jgi:hypothetical protein